MPSPENKCRIRPWAENPRYWQYKGKPLLLLGGTREDNLFQIPDLEEHLDQLADIGGNYIRNTMSDRDKGDFYPYQCLPSGSYDLDQWSERYWKRFDAMLRLTNERDIIVQIEVWDRFDYSDVDGMDNWQRHPYRPANNINYTEEETGLADGYPDHPTKDKHPFFHTIPSMKEYESRFDRLRTYQERFVRKMLSYSLPYGNVLYCMNNETSTDVRWGQYWMAIIKGQTEQVGVDVFVTDMFDDVWKPQASDMLKVILENPQLYDFLDISQVNSRNFGEAHWDSLYWIVEQAKDPPRPLNHTKIYSDGQTAWGSGTPQDGIERFWRNLLCGSASARFHRPPAGIGLNKAAQGCIQAARRVERLVRFWDLRPHMELLSGRVENGAYLAATPGQAYILFFPRGGTVDLNLVDTVESVTVTWVNVNSGQLSESREMAGGGVISISAPTPSLWVAVIINKV